ncbi:hypothetical protein [Janthinobacterium sp. 78]|uniref:hypothetical protein n=1 Tax=Janthinobacterium sp. 78 TaxID=2135631 RepID=UPI001057F63B|nr:hypothetical protein [Janthinobacterium sp. 78]
MRRAQQLAGKMPSHDVATQQHRMAERKKGNCRIFRTAHCALARHGSGMFALAQGKISMAKPSFALAPACRPPTMHPPDIDNKYDFIHVLSRNAYK